MSGKSSMKAEESMKSGQGLVTYEPKYRQMRGNVRQGKKAILEATLHALYKNFRNNVC